jgi:intergrase/recombinase
LKTIRISEASHNELTRLLGKMMAKTGKPKTYRDVIDALTERSVILSADLLERIDEAIGDKPLGYATRQEFVEDAVKAFLQK